MSQITLTHEERVQALVRLGYTHREAAFLCLVGLHSGFFLRRQFCRFIGREIGGIAAALIEKILSKGHGIAVTGCRNAKVYHLCARPFYAALGQEDNRNRRHREPAAIKNRLMCLDFILDHPGHQYLATEQDKVSYFTCTLGIEITELPAKDFRSPNGEESCMRFFVEKYPIFIPAGSPNAPGVSFCFIDEGSLTCGRFESFLKQYSRLFARLPRYEVIYAAASQVPFPAAQEAFNNFLASSGAGPQSSENGWDLERLLGHFQQRRRFETGQFEGFGRPELIRLRDDREQFSGRFFDALWRRWKTGGDVAVREALTVQGPVPDLSHGRFSTFLLQHPYDIFGPMEYGK